MRAADGRPAGASIVRFLRFALTRFARNRFIDLSEFVQRNLECLGNTLGEA